MTRDQAIDRLNQIPTDLARKAIRRVCAIEGGDPSQGVRYELDAKWAETFWRVQDILDARCPTVEVRLAEIIEVFMAEFPASAGDQEARPSHGCAYQGCMLGEVCGMRGNYAPGNVAECNLPTLAGDQGSREASPEGGCGGPQESCIPCRAPRRHETTLCPECGVWWCDECSVPASLPSSPKGAEEGMWCPVCGGDGGTLKLGTCHRCGGTGRVTK